MKSTAPRNDLLTEQLNVSLTESTMEALVALRRKSGIKPTDYARLAIEEKLLATGLSRLSEAEQLVLSSAQAHGIAPFAAIAQAIKLGVPAEQLHARLNLLVEESLASSPPALATA